MASNAMAEDTLPGSNLTGAKLGIEELRLKVTEKSIYQGKHKENHGVRKRVEWVGTLETDDFAN